MLHQLLLLQAEALWNLFKVQSPHPRQNVAWRQTSIIRTGYLWRILQKANKVTAKVQSVNIRLCTDATVMCNCFGIFGNLPPGWGLASGASHRRIREGKQKTESIVINDCILLLTKPPHSVVAACAGQTTVFRVRLAF